MPWRSEDGLSLVLALVFVLVISLTVTALLPYTGTGLKAAGAVRDVRTVQNAADGAVDAAINAIRSSFVLGSSPGCPASAQLPQDFKYPNPAPATGDTTVRVSYCNDTTSAPPVDQPPFAIQTLQGGIAIDGNAPLLVSGGIVANGPVSVTGTQQSLNVSGDLYATGTCSAKSLLVVSGVQHCANTTPPYSAASDPAMSDPLASLANPVAAGLPATVDPVGACDSTRGDSVVTFSPGFYSETPQPDTNTTSSTYCGTGNKHVLWWFQPGVYYFDFPDSRFPGYASADASFLAPNITIVGGTPLGWTPATAVASDVVALFKNGPTNTDHVPVCDETKPGATFTFGGPTNIDVGSGGTAANDLEICPGPVGTQYISLFGLRTADGTSRTSTATGPSGFPSLMATSVATGYLLPDNAKVIGETPTALSAAATLSGDNTPAIPNKAVLTLAGTPNLTAIPDGSLITAAQIRLVYSTTGTTGSVANKLTYSSTVLPPTPVTLPSTSPAGGQIVPVTLTGTPRWRSLKDTVQNLQLVFTADGSALKPTTTSSKGKVTPAETAMSSIDGIQLEVSYIAPKVEAVRCLQGGTSPCNIFTNKVDDTAFLHGTVYTPQSILEAAVHNYSTTVFERGVISASLLIHVSASAKQTLPPFQLPKGTKKRLVRFVAESLEPDGSWKVRLIARVRYDDFLLRPGGKSTAVPGRNVEVLNWTIRR